MRRLRSRRESLLFALALGLLGAGLLAAVAGAGRLAEVMWTGGTVLGLLASAGWTLVAMHAREPTVDMIAVLALVGTLLVDEPLAGAIVTAMLACGQLLESHATARARRELSLLASRAPRTARRVTHGMVAEIPAGEVVPGDRLLVGSGEIVAVDGLLLTCATLDESALTGEPMPVERGPASDVRSGVVNAGPPLELLASATAADSTYSAVARLVDQARASSSPFVRMADRTAAAFVPVAVLLAAAAWAASGDPVRAVAVLVVATPCPLLLAAPIAIISGVSRMARSGIIAKGGGALERLALGRVVLFDKTGTLTFGRPRLLGISAVDPFTPDDVLRLAACLGQASAHPLAGAVVTAASAAGLVLLPPRDVVDHHGAGLSGRVAGRDARVGTASWVSDQPLSDRLRQARRRADLEGSPMALVSVGGAFAGALLFADPIRPEAASTVRGLRRAGIERVVLVTGDRADVADAVGKAIGVDAVVSQCDPADKVRVVARESAFAPTIMVGDGINDAPALAAAGVGVALASRGVSVSSEAADVVITVDRVDAVAQAIAIAHRTRRIAVRAVALGMGLALVAMAAAAWGLLPPAAGALLQEAIDVVTIGLALTALLPGKDGRQGRGPRRAEDAAQVSPERATCPEGLEQFRAAADGLAWPR